MGAVNQTVDETVFRYRTEGVEDTTRKVDGLASAQEGLASANDGATASSERAERRVRTMADAQAIAQRQLEATLRLTEQMDRANSAYGQSVAAAAANENKAAVERASAVAAIGDAFKATAKFALEHPIIFGAAASMSARALSGLAASAATSLAGASAATAQFANDNTAMGGKVAAAANVASRGLAATSAAATAAAGGLGTFADKASSLTSILLGLIRVVRLVGGALGGPAVLAAVIAFELVSKAIDKAYADLERLVALGRQAEKLDVSAPFLKSFTGLGAKVRAETTEMEVALKQASGFVEAQFGGDRLAKLVADIAAQTGGAALRAAQQIDLAQGTEERIRAALAAMVELEARGQRLAAIDLGEKVFGASFVERVRRGQISFAQIAEDLNGLRDRELIRQQDVTHAVALAREIEDVKGEIGKALEVTFDFSAAAMAVDQAWLSVLKTVRDVAVAIDNATRPGEAAIQRRIQALQAQADRIETVSIPMQLKLGNLDAVENLRTLVAGLRDQVDQLSPSLANAERAIDAAVGRVPPALPVMSDELATMRAAAEAAARGLDSTGASAAAAGAQLAGAAAKAQGFAAALNAIQAANPNLASTISLMGQVGDIQKKVADGSKAVFEAFDAGKITDPEAQQLVKKLNDDAAESIKALRTEAEKPWKSYAREAELGTMKELPKALAEAGDKYAETRRQAEAYYRVQVERATPEARGALEKERAEALAGIDAAFKKIETTTRDNAAERGAKAAGKAAKDAEKDFDDFKSKAEEAFKRVFPADALRKQGEEFQKELDKYRDRLNAIDPRLVTSMEARIKLNLSGKEVEGVKEQTDELAKEMSSAFRGVFDEMFSSANKGFAGLLDGFTKSLSRIGTRLMESTFLTPLFSGKEGAGAGGFNFGSFDFGKLQESLSKGSFDGITEAFGDLLKPGSGGAKGTGFASTKLGGGLVSAGVGASIGYQSQSPLIGALGGAASGFAMGGPVGAVVGGITGLLGGLFGRSQAKKEAEKKLREQLEAYKEAYRQAEPEIKKLQATFRGESLGAVGERIEAAHQQMYQANVTASKAGDQARANQLVKDFEAYAFRLRDQFTFAFEGTLKEVADGFGTSGPFATANAAIATLGEQLKAFVADAASLPFPEINAPRARAAAQQAALATLDPPKALSDVQSRLAAIQGTASGLGTVLKDLGMSAEAAATAIRDKTAVAMEALRAQFSSDLATKTNEATGKGYLNEVADLVKEREGLLADAKAIGAGTADVTAYFRAAAQKIVDSSELTGDAFTALVRRFPELRGAVVEFGQAIESVAAKAEAAARAASYDDRRFAANTDTSTLAGALAAQDRKAAADRLAEQKAGGRAMADLEKALADERTRIITDFQARANEIETAAAEAGQRRALAAEDRLFAARTDTATLTGKLADLDRRHAQEQLSERDADGRAMAKLLEAQAAERLKIVREAGAAEVAARKQALAEAQTFLDGAAKNIRTYLDGLKAGPETNLSPGERLKAAQAQFDAQLKLAKGGNRDALSSITSYADRLLDAGKKQYASGRGYQDIVGAVTKQLGDLPSQVSAEQYIVDAIKTQTSDLQSTLTLDTPAAMAAAVHKDFPKLDINKDGLLSSKEFLDGLGPLASKEEQQEALKVFRAIDLDGDGQISKLEALHAALGSNLLGVDAVTRAVNDNFDRLDKDGSGGLSLTEFKAAFGPLATQADQKLAEAYFREIDTNGDGFISKMELVRADLLAQLKLNDPAKMGSAIANSFQAIDLNADAKIDWSEYVKAVGPATKAEQDAAKAVFDRLDTDGDGFITKMEAVRADLLAQLKLNDPAKIAAALLPGFAEIDTNKDKGIDFEEYAKAIGATSAADRKTAAQMFMQMDRDRDGTLTQFELVGWAIVDAVKANNASAFATALDKNFNTLNTTVDGVLDQKELEAAIKGLATAADQEKARGWIEKLDTNGNKQLDKQELLRLRLVDVNTNTKDVKEATDKGKSATDTVTGAVKTGNDTAAASKALLDSIKGFSADQKLILTTIQGYQDTAKNTLGEIKSQSILQKGQLDLLNKQFTLSSPVGIAGTKISLNNDLLDALNKIVFNTGMTANGLIKLMSTGKPDGLLFAFAEGGWVRGPGTGTSDSIGARLSNGEFVVNAAAARMNGGLLEAMNDNRPIMPLLAAMNDNRSFGMPAVTMPVPMPIPLMAGGGVDAAAIVAAIRSLEARMDRSDDRRKAEAEMIARISKAAGDKVADKVEETTDEVAGSREDARRDAAPKRAGRGEPVRSAA